MILHDISNKQTYIMILHYEGLSAINNIKYHDITMKGYQQ